MASSNLRNPNVFVQAAAALQVVKGQLGLDISVPQFALVGMQSAGKTRMLCALARRKIGGAEKAETGTRCPVIYHFEISDGEECCKIGTSLTAMQAVPASELHVFITNHMAKLEKVGFSEEPLFVHIKGDSSLNARIVDLPGLKPPGAPSAKNANNQIGRIIRKYVSELGYTPLVMSGFNEKMDMDYVSSELDSVLQQFNNREQTAKNSIIFVSRLDFARQGLVQNPKKLDEFIDTAKRLNFQPSNIIFFSLMPELLDGQSHCRPGDTYEEQTEYFQNILPYKEEELLPTFLSDMRVEKSKYNFGVKTAIDVIETKLETSFRGNFQEVISKMREKWLKIEGNIKAATPVEPNDSKFKEIVRAYVMLITDVLSGTATCDHQRIVNSLAVTFRQYPLKIDRGDEKMADDLIKKLSMTFEEEKELVSTKMSLSNFAFLFDEGIMKKLKGKHEKKPQHTIARKLGQRLAAGGALYRLLSLFTFAVMERDIREFKSEDVYNMADMLDMNCKRGFSSAMVIRKMVNQLTIAPQSYETIVWWSAWVYISQAAVVCQELRKNVRLLDGFPELRDHLDTMLMAEYEHFFKQAAKDTAVKIAEMIDVRFGTLKLDELTASIRLLGCCKLDRSMLQVETSVANPANKLGGTFSLLDGIPSQIQECITPLLTMACPVPGLSPILAEAIKLGLNLYESRKQGRNNSIEYTFDFFSKIAPSQAHEFASFDGLKLQEIGQGEVEDRIKDLNSTANMVARFNSGMALLEIVSYIERFAEKARQLNHDINKSMMARVNRLLEDEQQASTLQRLIRGSDKRRIEDMKTAANEAQWFIEAAEKINLCCSEVKCAKLDVERAKRHVEALTKRLEANEQAMNAGLEADGKTGDKTKPEADCDPLKEDKGDTHVEIVSSAELEQLLQIEEKKALQATVERLKVQLREKDREIEQLRSGILGEQPKEKVEDAAESEANEPDDVKILEQYSGTPTLQNNDDAISMFSGRDDTISVQGLDATNDPKQVAGKDSKDKKKDKDKDKKKNKLFS